MSAPVIIPRSVWVPIDFPFSGPPIDWGLVHTHVAHFPGTAYSSMDFDRDGTPGDVDDTVRNVRNGHIWYKQKRGYSYGYGHIVGLLGDHAVAARGWDLRNAANVGTQAKTGVSNFNPFSVSTQLLVNLTQKASAEQIEAFAWLHLEAEKRAGRRLWLKGHGQVGDTSCPGRIAEQYHLLADAIERERARRVAPAPPPPPPAEGQGTLLVNGWYKRGVEEWAWSIATNIYDNPLRYPIVQEDNPGLVKGPPPEWVEARHGVDGVNTHTVVGHVQAGETLTAAMRRLYPGVDVADRIGPTCFWSKIADKDVVFPNQLISIPVYWPRKAPAQ